MPQAKLQPMALRSIWCTSPGPDWATLSELVKVTTIISPHRTSAARAKGSTMRLEDLMCLSGIRVSKDRWPVDPPLGTLLLWPFRGIGLEALMPRGEDVVLSD